MVLDAGSRLGAFEILSELRAGGMGVVYRARDTKLHREVALKVLPEAFASDPERLVRFQREARAVASLNHPNIVTIYSVEEIDGLHFLTMELVEGTDLGDLIAPGGLPLEKIPRSSFRFAPNSWSPDGRWIAGQDGFNTLGVFIYSTATNTYDRPLDFGEWPVWLPTAGACSSCRGAGSFTSWTRAHERAG